MNKKQITGPDGKAKIRVKAMSQRIASADPMAGRNIRANDITYGLTPARLAALLRDNADTQDPVDMMDLAYALEQRLPQYISVLNTRKNAVAQLPITVVEGRGPNAAAHKDFIDRWLERDRLQSELKEILDALGKGFSVTEIIWKATGTEWYPDRLSWVDPRYIAFRDDLETPYLKNGIGGERTGLNLERGKFIYCRMTALSGTVAHQGSLARLCAWPYMFLNFDMEAWARFIEKYGHPAIYGRYSSTATEEERKSLLRAIRALGRDWAGIVPQGSEFDVIESKGSADGGLFSKFADRWDKAISKIVLGQTMTTDDGSSRSQAEVHNEVREDIERSDAEQLAAVLNDQLIQPMIDINYGPQDSYPTLNIGRPQSIPVTELSTSVGIFERLGLPVSKRQMRALTGLDEPDDEADSILGGSSGAQREADTDSPNGATGEVGEEDQLVARFTNQPKGDAVDVFTADLLKDGPSLLQPLQEELDKLAEGVDSFDDFLDGLTTALSDASLGPLQSHLANRLGAMRVGAAVAADGEPDEQNTGAQVSQAEATRNA